MARIEFFGGDRARPFAGQHHTWTGERGKPQIPAMRYRDLGDTIVEALRGFPEIDHVDLNAVAQKILFQIEQEGVDERTRIKREEAP